MFKTTLAKSIKILVEVTARFGANNLITLVIMSYRSELRKLYT